MARRSLIRFATLAVIGITAVACADNAPMEASASAHSHLADAKSDQSGVQVGTTAGWLNGKTVTFFYNQPFDCPGPLDDGGAIGAESGCALGAAAAEPPRGGNSPVVYVTVPLFADTDGITLHCPEAGNCINHPTTMDLSRVFGAGSENALLPPHSHVVDVQRGGWWEIEVNGVTTRAAWDAIQREKSLAAIRTQQQLGSVTPDLHTNLFLFFNVLGDNDRRNGVSGR